MPDCGWTDCGDDGCNGSCGTCADWETCIYGWCLLTGEAGDCRDILLCAVACEFYQDCLADCYLQSSLNGQKAYDEMTDCSATVCEAYENQSAAHAPPPRLALTPAS